MIIINPESAVSVHLGITSWQSTVYLLRFGETKLTVSFSSVRAELFDNQFLHFCFTSEAENGPKQNDLG